MGGRGRNWDVVVVVVVVVAGQGGLGADGVGVVVVGDWCGCWVRGGADGSRLREDIFGDRTGPAGPSSVRSPSEMEMGDDGAFLLWREIGRGGVALESSKDVGLDSGL